jgi:hypothetical protein
MMLLVPRMSDPDTDRRSSSPVTQVETERMTRVFNTAVAGSFTLCLMLWVLPIEADFLVGFVWMYPFVWVLLGHVAVTCLINAPLVDAVRRGVPVRRLLSSLRVWTVIFFTVLWAGMFVFFAAQSLTDGTFFTAPRLLKKSTNSGQT